MSHQHILDQWAELNLMIESARLTTDHPDAHACMDAMRQLADEHSAIMVEKKAEHDASHASKPEEPKE